MIRRALPTIFVAVIGATVLAGCGEPARTPSATATQQSPAAAPSTATIVGLMKSADDRQVVIGLPDGSTRTFLVREQDVSRIGIEHLASHAGLADVGFEVAYETVDGKDYILGAQETAPPQ